MKILLISRGWPTPKDPKWGCFEKDQAEALKALGHEVKVLCLDCRFSFKPYIPKIRSTTINGIDYISFRGLPQVLVALIVGDKMAIKYEKWMLLKIYKKLISTGYKPDIVYSHFIMNSGAATILKEKYGLPLVVIEHSSKLVSNSMKSINKLHAVDAYNNANQVIAVSDYLKKKIEESFGIKSIVVPNMLGQEFMSPPRKSANNDNKKIKFISIGTLIPLKGYSELLDAFSKANLPSNWELDIIGYGPLENKLKAQVKTLGLDNHVVFLGPKNKNEIIYEMANSSVFILNTKKETFGVVYIEALSQGLPCIATECGGAEGIIDESNGINVEVGNEKALIDALEYMSIHYNDYNNKEIREKCLEKYSPQQVAKRIEVILKNNIQK